MGEFCIIIEDSRMDYYETLNVDKNASTKQIKKAYLRLAKEWHPDKHQHKKDVAEAKFKEIGEAYSVLIDKDERYLYDFNNQHNNLNTNQHNNLNTNKDNQDTNSEIMIQEIFENLKNQSQKDTIETNIELTLKQMYTGHTIQHNMKHIISRKNIKLDLVLNPGVYNGFQMFMEDVNINVMCTILEKAEEIKSHKFIRNYDNNINNLLYELDVSFADSLCGVNTSFKHLDGHNVDFNINYPVRHGDLFVLKKKGMPILNSCSEYGDLIVRIVTQHPKELKLSRITMHKIYKDITKTDYIKQNSPKTKTKTQIKPVPMNEYILQQNNSDSMSDDENLEPTTCHTQ